MTILAHGKTFSPIHSGLKNNFNIVKQLLKHRLNEFTGTGGALQKLKHEWKENSNARLIIGAGLLTGGLIATATGAAGTAGVILATRTIISSLGAYITTEELCNKYMADETPTDKKKKIIIASTSALVMGIIGGSGVLNTLNDITPVDTLGKGSIGLEGNKSFSLMSEAHATPVTSNGTVVNQGISIGVEKNIAITDIIKDIKHDHPTQGYITLEQTIRRIEGLSQGIGLHESEKLKALNASVSQMVHTPGGKIEEIMKSLGYLRNGETVDIASRRLRIEDISNIATRYAEENGHVAVVKETIAGTPSTINSSPLEISPKATEINTSAGVNSVIPVKGEALATSVNPSSISESTPPKNHLPWWIAGGMGVIAASAYTWFSRKKQKEFGGSRPEVIVPVENILTPSSQNKRSTSDQVNSIPPQDSALQNISLVTPVTNIERIDPTISEAPPTHPNERNEIITSNEPGQQTVSVTGTEVIPGAINQTNNTALEEIPYTLNAEQITAKGIITEYLTTIYRWESINTENSTSEYSETFLGRSVGGAYIVTVHYCESGIWFETLWKNKDRFHPLETSKLFSPISIISPIDRENGFNEQFDDYFLENCKTRDKIGCALLKEVTKFALTREMLREIYNQANSPDFHNLETQGSLYANSQEIQDGILRFILHSIPKRDELDVGSAIVSLRGDTGGIYFNQRPIDVINGTHSEKEASIMISHICKILGTNYPMIFIGNPNNNYYKVKGIIQNTFRGVHPFPGSIVHRTWHKHPPGILSPSSGDLINGEMDTVNRYRGLEYFFHFIVVPIPESDTLRYQNDPYFHLMSGNEYGGTQSYLISGYKYKNNGRGSGNEVTKLKLIIE